MDEFFLGENFDDLEYADGYLDSIFKLLNANFLYFKMENNLVKQYKLLIIYIYCVRIPESPRKIFIDEYFNLHRILSRSDYLN